MKPLPQLLAATAILLASACSQGGDEANRAAPINEQAASDPGAMMADPNNPFAEGEMQMRDRMMAAVGSDPADSWVRKMIEHHRGALAMSNIVLSQTQDPRIRRLAQMTIDKQSREIEELEGLVKQRTTPAPQSAELYRPVEMEMHEGMMAARGASVDETWARKMIEHHRGAIAMSDLVLAQDPPSSIRRLAGEVKSDQLKDIGDLEALLRGETPAAAAPAAPAKAPTPEPKAAAPRPKAKAAPAAKASPSPTPDPHAGHDMNSM